MPGPSVVCELGALSGARVACPPAQPGSGQQCHRHPCPWLQICVPVETTSPLVTSNQKEVLRCFTVLGEWLPGLGMVHSACACVGLTPRVPPVAGLEV